MLSSLVCVCIGGWGVGVGCSLGSLTFAAVNTDGVLPFVRSQQNYGVEQELELSLSRSSFILLFCSLTRSVQAISP